MNFEQAHYYSVKSGSAAAPEYTLTGQPGAVLLKKDGAVVSSIQVVPSPVAGTLLAADASGMHWESEQAHGTHGSGGGSDGYITPIDIGTDGKITATRQPGGVAITRAQSRIDIHPTLTSRTRSP